MHTSPPHKADIKALLEKRGIALTDLDQAHGLVEGACSVALRKPHAAGERVIAAALGRSPQDLWPNRYTPSGVRLAPQPRINYGRDPDAGARPKDRAA